MLQIQTNHVEPDNLGISRLTLQMDHQRDLDGGNSVCIYRRKRWGKSDWRPDFRFPGQPLRDDLSLGRLGMRPSSQRLRRSI